MSGILLPEVLLYNILTKMVSFLRMDLESNTDSDTFLYKILGLDESGEFIKMNLYNYFDQAKKMILNKQNLSVNFGYNLSVAKFASIHILLPSEHATSPIGEDEGYMEDDIFDENNNIKSKQEYLSQTFESTYQIMITSMNSIETNVIYNILKSTFLVLVPQIELMGLRVPTFSGNDIVMQDDLAEVPIFHKVLNITFKYEHIVPKITVENIAKHFKVILRPVEKI